VVGAIEVVEPCGASVVGGAMARDALQPAAAVAETAPIASAANARRPTRTIAPSWPVGRREGRHLTPRIARLPAQRES
jgi:hypothetical protein